MGSAAGLPVFLHVPVPVLHGLSWLLASPLPGFLDRAPLPMHVVGAVLDMAYRPAACECWKMAPSSTLGARESTFIYPMCRDRATVCCCA